VSARCGRGRAAGAPARRTAERRGRRAERLAAFSLRLVGWRILARRWRSKAGEIDLVARRGRLIAFIEVKARSEIGDALEAVSARQRARIVRAASSFLAQHPKFANLDARFDVVAVTPGRWPRHIPDAWRP
jgi:putative endonuclease